KEFLAEEVGGKESRHVNEHGCQEDAHSGNLAPDETNGDGPRPAVDEVEQERDDGRGEDDGHEDQKARGEVSSEAKAHFGMRILPRQEEGQREETEKGDEDDRDAGRVSEKARELDASRFRERSDEEVGAVPDVRERAEE